MKSQALFSSKDKSIKKCRLLRCLFGALRVSKYETVNVKLQIERLFCRSCPSLMSVKCYSKSN